MYIHPLKFIFSLVCPLKKCIPLRKLLPANLIFKRSKGWRIRVETIPPETKYVKMNYANKP